MFHTFSANPFGFRPAQVTTNTWLIPDISSLWDMDADFSSASLTVAASVRAMGGMPEMAPTMPGVGEKAGTAVI